MAVDRRGEWRPLAGIDIVIPQSGPVSIRTKANPWKLKTAPGTAEFTMQVDDMDGQQVLMCTVGKTVLHYDARCVDDLHAMLKAHGDWMELGGADGQKPAKEGRRGAGHRRIP